MTTKKHDGVCYAFMYWSHQDNMWMRCHRLFHLTNYKNNNLYGQYITDMEFNVSIEDDKPKHFIIIGVKDRETFMSLESTINNKLNEIPNISNLTNVTNLNLYFKEYFMIKKEEWTKYKKSILSKEKSSKYKMYGELNCKNQLELRFDYHEHYGIMCCLPSFSIIV